MPAPLTGAALGNLRVIDMRTLVTLAQTQHFGQAARLLGTSQPVVSSRILRIEEQLGQHLVDRSNRSFALTPEGRLAVESFRDMLESVRSLADRLDRTDSPAPAIVRIGAIDTAVSSWLPSLVDRLHMRLPHLRIDLSIQGTADLLSDFAAGQLDLIFALEAGIGEDAHTWFACSYDMVWVCAPSRRPRKKVLDVAELAALPIISYPKNTPPFRLLAAYLQGEQALAEHLMSCNSLFAIINLAVSGHGVALVPRVTVLRELDEGTLVTLALEREISPMVLIASWHESSDRRLLQHINDETRREIRRFCENTDSVSL